MITHKMSHGRNIILGRRNKTYLGELFLLNTMGNGIKSMKEHHQQWFI